MPYQYRLRDTLGQVREGRLEAASIDEATAVLRRDGSYVLELEEADDDLGLFARPVRKRDLIYITTQLAIMVDTGITLSVALGSIVQQERNPSLKKVLAALKSKVEGGEDFSTALAEHPKLFDKTFVSLIRASEATGKLGEMLNRLATYLRKEVDTRSKVRAAMAYPTVMLVVATCATIFLLTFVMPKFTPLFQARGNALPASTRFMMMVSDAMINYWWAWIASVVLLVGGFLYGKRTDPGRRVWDWLKINTPIIGPMFRKVAISAAFARWER